MPPTPQKGLPNEPKALQRPPPQSRSPQPSRPGLVGLTARRVLIVGDFGRSSFGASYYNMNFVLQAGFIRAGCHVLTFSDRDVARERSIFRRKMAGRSAMNRDLIATAKTYQPHLILFGHADMTSGPTFEALRAAVPGVFLAQFNVDPLFRARTMQQFVERAHHMERSFITTADRLALAALGAPKGTVAFFPNPVDASLAIADVSTVPRDDLRFDGVFLGSGEKRRSVQIEALQNALPDRFRFHASGGIFNTERLRGFAFLEALTGAGMSVNLPLDDTVTVHHLYSSDRIAQLLGHGIVAFCHESAGLEGLYGDGIVSYSTIADLAEKMAGLAEDDARRRQIGALGRRVGLERTSAEQVARYMLDMTLGSGPTRPYGWPTELT